jgi:hypothetical protein
MAVPFLFSPEHMDIRETCFRKSYKTYHEAPSNSSRLINNLTKDIYVPIKASPYVMLYRFFYESINSGDKRKGDADHAGGAWQGGREERGVADD